MGGSLHSYKTKSGPQYFFSIYWRDKPYKIYRRPDNLEKFASKAQAEKWLNTARAEVDKGEFDPKHWKPDSPVLIRVHALDWLENKDVSKKTISGYRTAVKKYIIPFLGGNDIRHLRAGDIRKFKLWLVKDCKRAPKGVYNIIGALKTMLIDAHRDEVIKRVPPFPKLTVPETPIEYLEAEQQEIILNAIPVRDRPIYEFGMEYGFRTQEVRALMKESFKDGGFYIERAFSENTLSSTKTGRIRFYQLTSLAEQIIKRVPKHLGPFVFVRNDGKPYTNKDLNKIWHKACKACGITIKLQNAFRHSLGCQLLDQGESEGTVQQILGHTTRKMTKRYATRSVKTLTAALERRHVVKFQDHSNSKNDQQ